MQWQLRPDSRILIAADPSRTVERAAAYVQAEVEKRSGWRWSIVRGGEPMAGDLVLGILGDDAPPSPLMPQPGEEITLWCDGSGLPPTDAPIVYGWAGAPSVALALAGKLARSLNLQPGRVTVPTLALRERPAFPLRGRVYANHKQNTSVDKWSYAQWEENLTERAAWGDNLALTLPMHPTRWPNALPLDEPPWFDLAERQAEYDRQWEIQLKLPQLCHELGMRYGIWMCVNDVFPEEVVRNPHITKFGQSYVCPSIPEARERIRALRDRLFAALPALDILFLPSKDEGGCPACEDCEPWGPVYIELAKEQIAQARRYHPDCLVWMAQQGLSTQETEGLLAWLDEERPQWVEGMAFGPFSELMSFDSGHERGPGSDSVLSLEEYRHSGPVSGPVSRLRRGLPAQYNLILYPDETHTYRCQYPVVGMDRTVQYVWSREDGPCPRPVEMAEKHAATAPVSDGAVPYSEGDHDDVNKVVWDVRNWNPHASGEQIAYEYAAWYFGAACADDGAALILKLEQILNAPLYSNGAVAEAVALVEACERRQPTLLDNWRWLNLRVGVLMLDYIQRVMVRDRELMAQVRYRVAVWRSWSDPAPGLRATIRFLERRFAETDALLRDVVWTRDRLFRLHRLAIRGVARLQHSYIKMDVLLVEWKNILARLEQGELQHYPERYDALLRPLLEIEDGPRLVNEGVPLVEHIREFTWETGEPKWQWRLEPAAR